MEILAEYKDFLMLIAGEGLISKPSPYIYIFYNPDYDSFVRHPQRHDEHCLDLVSILDKSSPGRSLADDDLLSRGGKKRNLEILQNESVVIEELSRKELDTEKMKISLGMYPIPTLGKNNNETNVYSKSSVYIVSNHLPRLKDADKEVINKVLIIPMPYPVYFTTSKEEYDELMSIAFSLRVEGARRAIDDDEIEIPQTILKETQEWRDSFN